MLIESPESLQIWLASYLEPLCDADPQALAQYVMALIGKDKPEEDLRQILSQQLEVFLQKETIPFVDVLFDTLENKSYLEPVYLGSPSDSTSHDESTFGVDQQISDDEAYSVTEGLLSYTPEYEPTRLNNHRSRSRSRSPASLIHHQRPLDVDMRRPEGYVVIPGSSRDSDVTQQDYFRLYTRRTRYRSRTPDRKSRSRSYSPRPINHERNHGLSEDSSSPDRKRVIFPVFGVEDEDSVQEIEDKKPLINQDCCEYDDRGLCLRGDFCPFHAQSQSNDDNQNWNNISNHPLRSIPTTSNENISFGSSIVQPVKRNRKRKNRRRRRFRQMDRRLIQLEYNNKNTLEVRKIPPSLNTIANLNSHFSKFGPIVNLQVGYDGDPRAALIKFVGHKDAMAAYRSTEAIFNNRFIKVFWHPNNNNDQRQQLISFSPPYPFNNQEPGHFHPHNQQNNHLHNHFTPSDHHNSQYYLSNECTDSNEFTFSRSDIKNRLGFRNGFEFDRNMTISTSYNSSGTISRTVHNPALMKSHYSSSNSVNNTTINNFTPKFIIDNQPVKPELNGEGFGVAPFNNGSKPLEPIQQQPSPAIKSKEGIQRDKIMVKLDLQKKRQHILVACMQNQKLLIEKLEKAKSDKEKLEIRTTVDIFDKQITKLESEIKKDTEILLDDIAKLPSSIRKNKIQVEKELLDAEMDFYNELHKGATASELNKKLDNIKTKANASCLNDLRSTKNMIKRFTKMKMALRDRNRFANHTYAKNFENLRKVDRRTRKIFIEGVTENDTSVLLSHLSQKAEIESLETTPRGVMVTFKTRRDAEMALPLISKVKLKGETTLKASWFDEAVLCSSLLCYISFLCPN